ncbi:MAG: NAD(P)(+) transhydrogenase (Si-specific) [Planctomycetota bacterium]
MKHYDVAIIGTGPAGQKGAIQAAKLGKSVAIVEKSNVLGGAQINTGTIPSKALREAALHLTGANKRGLFGESYRVKKHISIADLVSVSQQVIRHEWEVIRDQFERNGVDLIWGAGHFEGPNLLQINREDSTEMITADKFLIGVGTRPAKPKSVPFNQHNILSSDSFLRLQRLPKTMIVVGGGVIGTEYACIMATLGVRVTLVEGRHQVLGFLDQQIGEAFQYFMRQAGITLRLGEKVEQIRETNEQVNGDPDVKLVEARLESGKSLKAETLLYCVGRQGVCGELGLDNVGITYDDRERLKVNTHYQTLTLSPELNGQAEKTAAIGNEAATHAEVKDDVSGKPEYHTVDHIYAAGDVIGFPALASTSMEQGRRAVLHAFGHDVDNFNNVFPFGVYAVPEISMIGKTEEQLTQEGIPYEAGIATYDEIARGQLLGDRTGMLKLLIHQDTHELLGVHAIGTGATELIHIGQAVMGLGGKAEFFIDNVFNFPTLAEAYKVAAYNGLNKLAHV